MRRSCADASRTIFSILFWCHTGGPRSRKSTLNRIREEIRARLERWVSWEFGYEIRYRGISCYATYQITIYIIFFSQNIPLSKHFLSLDRTRSCIDCLNEICKHSMNFILENIKILEERKKIREEKKKKKSCLQYVYFCENDKQLNWIKCIDV